MDTSEKEIGNDTNIVQAVRDRTEDRKSWTKHIPLFIIGILLLLVTVLSIQLFEIKGHLGREDDSAAIPAFTRRRKIFQQEIEWEDPLNGTILWNSLLPGGSGLVLIREPQKYGLPPGLKTSAPNANVYGVSFTHQFHCTRMIREALIGLAYQSEAVMKQMTPSDDPTKPLPDHLSHIMHCFDYLRQTILCNADMTVEWRADGHGQHIDGYEIPHQCRDWEEVRDWMDKSTPPDPEYRKPL